MGCGRSKEKDDDGPNPEVRSHRSGSPPKGGIKQEIIDVHDTFRDKHGAPHLVWDKEAGKAAQEWAEALLRANTLKHGNHDGMGQNLFSSHGASVTAQQVVQFWYDEIKQYNYNSPMFTPGTGHFTQVVWASTTGIGVGVASEDRKTYVVCNYVPPGNVTGGDNFRQNVKPPL
jgi:uncharacterized protein YkwD